MPTQAILNSVQDFYADASTVQVRLNMTVNSSTATYTLAIQNGGSTYLTLNISAMPIGNQNIVQTLTSTQRNNLLSAMANVARFNATFELVTRDNGVTIGTSRANAIISISNASRPTTPSFTYADVNASTVAITGDDQKLVQNYSLVRLSNVSATAVNGASIASYKVSLGSASAVFTSGGTIDLPEGFVTTSGTQSLTVEVTDTRGFTNYKSITVYTIYAYGKPYLESSSVKRNSTNADKLNISFSGKYANSLPNNTVTASYKFKATNESTYGSPVSVTLTISGNTFSYSGTNLGSFDINTSYDVIITITDILNSVEYTFLVIAAPLIAFRDKAIGIGMIPSSTNMVEVNPAWDFRATGHFKATSSQFLENGTYGIDMSNSDIINFNAIFASNVADSYDEGINFLRQNSNWDKIYAKDGTPYFMPNIPTGGPATTPEIILTSGNVADYVTQSYKSGIWRCRIWSSGVRELWGTMTLTISGWTKYGQIYYSNNYAQENYPSNFFASGTNPVFLVTGAGKLSVSSIDPYWGNDTNYSVHTPQVYAVRYDNAYTGQVFISVHAYTEVS